MGRSRGLRAHARGIGSVVCIVVATGAWATPANAGAGEPRPAEWQPPVRGPVVRSFAEPSSAYGAGHRGVDYAAATGTPVGAAGPGTVTFAGEVAGGLHVVVAHRAGVRTSYSFLLDVAVAAGQVVDAGTVVGHAGGADPASDHGVGVVHFGARIGERYVDPLTLFRPTDLSDLVRLVPVERDDARDASWARAPFDEQVALLQGLDAGVGPAPPGGEDAGCGGGIPIVGAAIDAVCTGVDWAAAGTRQAFDSGLALLHGAGRAGRSLATRFGPALARLLDDVQRAGEELRTRLLDTPFGRALSDIVEIGQRFLEWTRRECDTDAPQADGTGGSGHLVMAVAGIDSSSSEPGGRTFGLDVAALGYRRDDVHWYSYAADGGAYDADDTHGDLRIAAKRLAAQLRAVDAADPGRQVDLIAHSQGGVVVDRFLRFEYDASDPTFPPLGAVVTLSSPHQGAPLATTNDALRGGDRTRRVLEAIDPVVPGPPSGAVSVRQLAEDSPFMKRLHAAPLPEGIELTTIGGTDDLVVPANRIRVPGATEVVVGVDGLDDHTAIHHDERAMQAVRSALEGRPPPCTSLLEGLRAAVEPVLVSRVEGDLGEYVNTYLEVGR